MHGALLNGARVLVVDDNEDARELISTVIRSAGGTTIPVASVTEARQAIEVDAPDAIVSDISMPGENGYDFARELRSIEPTNAVPLVAVTAFTRVEDRNRALAAGFDAHLSKPFEARALVALLASLILDSKQHA